MASATSFYDFKPLNGSGEPIPLSEYKGKVVLVVNTASKCGFTPQLDGLQKLYEKMRATHGDKFELIAFPCNQFGSQDPGTDAEIQTFCSTNYNTKFPVMAKVEVNGKGAAPVWEWMKHEKPAKIGVGFVSKNVEMIKWNFEKFLIGADGKVKERWSSMAKPETLEATIEKELARAEKPAV
ncbi:glutathione peroxidase-like protein [Microthyrium microscopicum]|uniref:Glutathione peroxidase n=1 Tax=Microthyrium microscopicum TaxID=703497 RepID=A0A6A6UDV2_9PEZI|nr:glutathione peroxidase-like protein [Microthyrium microscopicum]